MDNPIRIGIVGLGRAGWSMHGPELAGMESKFQFVAACDILADRRERMAAKHGCKTFERIEDLVADPEVELVDIATRSSDHFAHAVTALRAGKYVFLEKPMCTDYEEALRLKDLNAETNGKLFIRHNRRFEPCFLHVREIIASGILGDVFEIKLTRSWYGRRDDWQALKRFGGGLLLNWGPHIIDHALQLLESPLKTLWSDLRLICAAGDAEDHIKLVFTGMNGRVVDMELTGGSVVPTPEVVLLGTRGGLASDGSSITLKYLDPGRPLPPLAAVPGTPGQSFGSEETLPWIEETIPVNPQKQYDIWDELYSAIRCGTTFPISMEEATEVMRVVSLAKEGTGF